MVAVLLLAVFFSDDEKLELMNAQKARLKREEHKREVQRLLEERRANVEQQKQLEREEREEQKRLEEYKRKIVEEERLRLLREHAERCDLFVCVLVRVCGGVLPMCR